MSAFRIQLAVGNPGASTLSIGVADFAAASLDRDYRRRGVRADSGGSLSAGANFWGTTTQLNRRRWRQTIAADGLVHLFINTLTYFALAKKWRLWQGRLCHKTVLWLLNFARVNAANWKQERQNIRYRIFK